MTTSSSLSPPPVYCDDGYIQSGGIIPEGLWTWSLGLPLPTPPKWLGELLPLDHPELSHDATAVPEEDVDKEDADASARKKLTPR